MSAVRSWARLYRVQRRVRCIRRLGACIRNHTKTWSTMNWGVNARPNKSQNTTEEHDDQKFITSMASQVDTAEGYVDTMQRTFQLCQNVIR